MALKDLIRRTKTGLGTLPNKGGGGRKVSGGFMPQPRLRPMPMPIARPPQQIQPMPIRPPQNLQPMPISRPPQMIQPMPVRPPILNKGPGSGPMPIKPPSIGRPPPPISIGRPPSIGRPIPISGQPIQPMPIAPPGQLLPPMDPADPRSRPISGEPPSRFGPDSFFTMFPDAPQPPQNVTADMAMWTNPITGQQETGSSSMRSYQNRLKTYLDANPAAQESYTQNVTSSTPPPTNQGPVLGRPEDLTLRRGRPTPPISIGGPGGGITSIGQPLDGSDPGLPRLPGGPNQPKPVELNDIGFGPGIIPSEIIGPDGQFIGSGGVTPSDDPRIPGMINENPIPFDPNTAVGSRLSGIPAPDTGQLMSNDQDRFNRFGGINDPRNQLGGGINLDDFRNTPVDISNIRSGVLDPGKPIPSMGPPIRPKPVELNDFGFGPGIRPSEITGPNGEFIGSGGVTPPGGTIRTMEFQDTDMNGVDDRDQPDFGGPSQAYLDQQAKMRDIFNPGQTNNPLGMEGAQDLINQQLPFGNLGGGFGGTSPVTGIGTPGYVSDIPPGFTTPMPGITVGSDLMRPQGPPGGPISMRPGFGGGGGDLAVMVYGPDGTEYSSPGAAQRAGVTDFTMSPPGASGGLRPLPPGFGITPRPVFREGFGKPGFGKPGFDREFDPSRLLGPGDPGYIDTGRLLPEPPGGLTPAPVVTPAPVIEPAPVTPPQSTTVAGNDPAVTGGTPTTGATSPVTPPAATPPAVTPPATTPVTDPAATPPATTATDPVASQNPFVSNLVRNETGMDAITKQLLFGLDGQGGFIPGAMQASENTFFNADGTPRVVEENVAGMSQDQKYAQELARQSIGMQDPYLQQAQDAYASGVDVLGKGLASAQQRGEQALGATQQGVAEEQALRNQGLAATLRGLGQGARIATDATSGLAGQLGNVEGIQRSAADQFGKQAGSVGAGAMGATDQFGNRIGNVEDIQTGAAQRFQNQSGAVGLGAMGATDRFGNRLGESEQLLRGTTGGYDQSMTNQFYNPYEDAVVDQVTKDLFKQYDKGDIAARASDISRGGESAYGSRARLGAGERAEAMGRGLAEAIGGIRSQGFQQAQQAGLGEFARQRQAERSAASGLSGLAGQRLGAQQNLTNLLRGVSSDQLSAQQNLASGLGSAAGQRLGAQQNLTGTLRGLSGDQLSAQQNLASGLGALAGQRYQAGTNLGSTLAGYGSQAGSALGGAGQAALGSAGQLAGAYGTMGGLEGQLGQQAQQAMFGLGSNLQGLGAQAQGASQQDIAQLYGLGQGQQALNQQRLDAMRRNALTAQQAPLAQYQSLMPFMQMVPQGQFNTQTTFGQRPSALQAGLGVGLSSLGAMGQFMNQGNR